MANLWTTDIDGERWLVNPQLILANPQRRKTKMAARRKKRQPAALRRYWAKHRKNSPPRRRRRARKNPFTASGMIANPRRRRARRNYSFMANRRRRRSAKRNYSFLANRRRRSSYRRNPQLLGFGIPPVMDVLSVGAGFVIPPVLMRYLMPLLPPDLQASRPVQYGVKIASVVLPAWAVKKFVSPRVGNLMLLGGLASLTFDLLRETGVLSAVGLSGSASQPMLGFYPSLSRRGGLGMGKYPSLQRGGGQTPVTSSRMLQSVPERLNPQSRF